MDLLVANAGYSGSGTYEANQLLLNDGAGGFTVSTGFPGGNEYTVSIAFGDVGTPINGAKPPDSG